MTEVNYIDLPAKELIERNTMLKREREAGKSSDELENKLKTEIAADNSINAVTICFSDLEGKLHLLDYNKNFFFNSCNNLTFDGSSINGFSQLHESDLRLFPDWSSFRWLPASVFGAGKVLLFGRIANQDGSTYESDIRSLLAEELMKIRNQKGLTVFVAPEIEGFLLDGTDSEQNYRQDDGFSLATKSGYFSSLPQDDLRLFIDAFARTLGMLGFENEKDHPEVAPSQFELNFRYTDALAAADQILLYKLVARQISKSLGYTSSFLPKPIAGLNGNGMHINLSVAKDGKNIFHGKKSSYDHLSDYGINFAAGILNKAKDICLAMNSSVNSYRRLDPSFEAPNQIKISTNDRGSMIRVPMGNESSARIEVRTVAPDANPYLTMYSIIKAGLDGVDKKLEAPKKVNTLPGNIYEALEYHRKSKYMQSILGKASHQKFYEIKQRIADRSPRSLGKFVKSSEVLFHHEVRNQYLWSQF